MVNKGGFEIYTTTSQQQQYQSLGEIMPSQDCMRLEFDLLANMEQSFYFHVTVESTPKER